MSKKQNRAWLLLDRSGSMMTRWVEAIGGLSAFVEGVPNDTQVTLDVFDAHQSDWYTRVRDSKQATFEKVTVDTVRPRGGTALNDALGRLLTEVIATKGKHVIVVTTDGQENASREFKQSDVKALLGKAEKAGVEIVWLGADFSQVEEQSSGYGLSNAKSMNSSAMNLENTYRGVAHKATMFYETDAPMSFAAGEKTAAMS